MKHNTLSLSQYMYETIAVGSTNQLPISSVCNASCIFCSNNMNPFHIHRIGFRSLDDIKKGIALLDPNTKAEIRIGDSLPGRISEGEAMLHPEILTILKLIREKVPGKVIQVNTNGTLLTKNFIESLIPFKPMKFTISYHSDNPEYWCKIFNFDPTRGREKYDIARNCFFLLKKNEFAVEATIVPLPTLVGYDDLENTIKSLRCYTKHILIYAPGFSKLVNPELKKILDVDYYELSKFLNTMIKKYKVSLSFFTDPLRPLDFFPHNFMMRSCDSNFKNVLWLFSKAAYKRCKKILEGYVPYVPNNHYPVQVNNRTYGGNISVAGLLMTDDFDKTIGRTLNKFADRNVKIDLIILPRIAFDRYGEDLKGCNYSTLTEKYKIPIWLG
jgi:uncharacterized Fe-S cluster-containing radical SAM superfamily protein